MRPTYPTKPDKGVLQYTSIELDGRTLEELVKLINEKINDDKEYTRISVSNSTLYLDYEEPNPNYQEQKEKYEAELKALREWEEKEVMKEALYKLYEKGCIKGEII